jgi:hypothetical protein
MTASGTPALRLAIGMVTATMLTSFAGRGTVLALHSVTVTKTLLLSQKPPFLVQSRPPLAGTPNSPARLLQNSYQKQRFIT